MNITIDDSRLTTIAQRTNFLKASQGMAVSSENIVMDEKYSCIDKTIDKHHPSGGLASYFG